MKTQLVKNLSMAFTILLHLQFLNASENDSSITTTGLSDWFVKEHANSLRFYDPDTGEEVKASANRDNSKKTCIGKKRVRPGKHEIKFWSNGLRRKARIHIPKSYNSQHAQPLVLNLHAFLNTPTAQEMLTRMLPLAEERGIIMVYPHGSFYSWNGGMCCGTASTSKVDDVEFIDKLIDKLTGDYCIDDRRIYATGMSNGGFMTHRLACELSDRIAAIAPVASVLGLPEASCIPERSVPIASFHGTNDLLVPYMGGTPVKPDLKVKFKFRSVDSTMSQWSDLNRCGYRKELVYNKKNVRCYQWQGCGRTATTIHCKAIGDTHTWPNAFGGWPTPATTRAIDASASILNFFEAHPMPH